MSSPRGSAITTDAQKNPHKRGSTCRSSVGGRGATLSKSWYADPPEEHYQTFIHTYTKNRRAAVATYQFATIINLQDLPAVQSFGIPNYKFNPSLFFSLLVFDSLNSTIGYFFPGLLNHNSISRVMIAFYCLHIAHMI